MRKSKYIYFIIILFISIGFAILSSNLSIGSSIAISNASFDVHFESASIYGTNVNNVNNPIINNDKDTVTINADLDKPGDYYSATFLIVNSGTIDAQLNEIIATTLTNDEKKYLTYDYNYYDGSAIAVGDLIRAGSKKKVLVSYQYKHNVSDLINISSKEINLSLKYIQPNDYNTDLWVYDYAGSPQTFKAPHTGSYKVELWGASGSPQYSNGRSGGGYTSGNIHLEKNDVLYVYVGGQGESFNFGSQVYHKDGGGATDVRLVGGSWSNFDSLKSRIMVAAGGGSSGGTNAWDSGEPYGGAAGGLNGYKGGDFYSYKTTLRVGPDGATQTTGTSFGNSKYQGAWQPSGGNGYFVGLSKGATGISGVYSTGGGSSYISGHIGCVAIEETSTEDNITFPTKHGVLCDDGTIDIDCSIHNSTIYFTNTTMIDGMGKEWKYHDGDTEVSASTDTVGMPTFDGSGTMIGNQSNGYAKITYLG
ncbi:MAG: glycine rich domain-containing protein [Bacilli bacterium]|nr:glycine rich domain-containing protein [Bacilli bacterium]